MPGRTWRARPLRWRSAIGSRRESSGDLDPRVTELGLRERLEARIEEGGSLGVGLHVLEQRAVRLQAADAAAQTAVPRQRDEGGAVLVQEGVILTRGEAEAEGIADGRARDRKQSLPPGLLAAAALSSRVEGERARSRPRASGHRRCRRSCAGPAAAGSSPARRGHAADRSPASRRTPGRVERGLAIQDQTAPCRGPWSAPGRRSGSATGPSSPRSASRRRPTAAPAPARPLRRSRDPPPAGRA